MKCPVCGHWVEHDDYWAGTMCLRCALEREIERNKKQEPE